MVKSVSATLLMVLLTATALRAQVVPPTDAREPVRLTLEQCREMGLARNPQIALAEAKKDQSKSQVIQAKANIYPSLDLSATAVRSNKLPQFDASEPSYYPVSMPMANPDGGLVPGLPSHIHLFAFPGFEMSNTREGDIYSVKLEAQYPLYTGGKVQKGIKAAQIYVELSEEEVRRQKNDLLYKIEEAFYGVLLTQEMVKVVDEAYGTAEAHYRQVQAFYQEGLVSSLDVLRVEAMLADLKPKQIEARSGLRMARLGLNNYLNIDLETPVEAVGELKYEPRDLPLPDDLYAEAIANRPEMRQMEINEELISILIEVNEACYRN